MKKVALGIDIGGTNTKYGFVDKEGKVYCESSISTTTPGEKFEDYLNNLYNEVQKSLESAPEELEIIGVGVGAPNGNYFNGCIEFAANLPWKGIIRAAQLMGDKWGVPAYLTNDANAAAIGEMLFGTAKGMKDFIVITLGTAGCRCPWQCAVPFSAQPHRRSLCLPDRASGCDRDPFRRTRRR